MALALAQSVRELREAFGLSRREAAPMFGVSDRTLEEVEYQRTRLDPDAARRAAEKLKAPEIAILAQQGGFPIYPLPKRIDRSLMATIAKGAKENREAAQVMEEVVYRLYNKDSADDLTEADRHSIRKVIKENAEATYVFHLLLILLVKVFDYGIGEIESLIWQAIHEDGLI